jgi:pimeloyl-ACP methyl ester carboxylesterase
MTHAHPGRRRAPSAHGHAPRPRKTPFPCCTAALLALAGMPLVCGCLAFHRGPMPGEPRDARFARVAGARVRFVDEGEGPAVVLIHGFASSLETWETVRPALRGRFRVLALDLKGFGWTDRPEGDYSVEAQAKLVLELMDRRGIRRAAVVGHSYGASVALAVALRAPERVSRLALYDAWAYEEQLPAFFHLSRAQGLGEALFGLWYGERTDERITLAFHDPEFVTEALVEDVDRALERPGTRAAALAAVRQMHYAHLERRYRTIRAPALLLWGREDRVTTLRVGERLARDLPRSRLVVYPNCGHFPMIEAAAQSTDELVRFLEEERVAPDVGPRGAPAPGEADSERGGPGSAP